MAKKNLTEEQIKEIKLLQANNEMLEKTKEEAKLRGKENSVKRIEIAQNDVIAQIAKIDEEIANETVEGNKNKETKKKTTKVVNVKTTQNDETVFDAIERLKKDKKEEKKEEEPKTVIEEKKETNIGNINHNIFQEIPTDVQYDIISLPSNGEGYPSKIGRLPVGYLTAYDENFLTSPNLYQDGLVIDFLLKNKILDKSFDIDKMYSGDADAVILFLRATSYGADFPISVRDPESKKRFDTTVDLTQFKNKEFKLKGDEEGFFSYTLPISKDEVKFKYLTRQEEKNLELLSEVETKNGRNTIIKRAERQLSTILEEEYVLNDVEKEEIETCLNKISEWADKVSEDDTTYISKLITNRMEMQIISVNGNKDKEYLAQYIKNMPVKDAFMLRRYIAENEPGIDWKITVERPSSLGGGSFETFLTWDDSVFFNISEG